MKKTTTTIFSTIAILIVLSNASHPWGRELCPVQYDLTVAFDATVQKDLKGFSYFYKLKNDAQSKQTVEVISVDNKGMPTELLVPPAWKGSYKKGRQANMEIFWFPGIDHHGEDASNQPPIGSLEPGQLSDPFGTLSTTGPPTIVGWRVEGWTPDPELDEGSGVVTYNGVEYTQDQLEDTDFVTKLINKKIFTVDCETNFVSGSTLGPSLPPTDPTVVCDTFILDLIGQVREAAALGWIKHDLRKDRDDDDDHGKRKGDEKGKKKSSSAKATEDRGQDDEGDDNGDYDRRDGGNPAKSMDGRERDDDISDADNQLPGVAKSIIKKLMKVRRECLRGKFGSAREKLRALIRQVNAQHGKHLTDEAFYLIRFNAEFLLEKL
ncbi:hypothetical protein HY522_09300 [bacterium]|nr:hypothetical protein [bacterium]